MTETPRHLALFLADLRGGGAQGVFVALARGLAARGHRVDLLVGNPHGPWREHVAPPVRLVPLARASQWQARRAALRADPEGLWKLLRPILLPLRTDRALPCLPALADYLARSRPDALIAAKVYGSLVALLARRLAEASTPVVCTVHGNFAPKLRRVRRWRWRHAVPLIHHLYPEADAVVAVSESLADAFAECTGLPRRDITAIHNPVISERTLARAQAPPPHPWLGGDGPPVILGVGRLHAPKGFATLVRAFARVRAQRPGRLIILGRGRQRAHLERLARELGVADDVDLPGYADNPPAYMARASVFVLSSLQEGLPGALIEAMACGCPVVATDCPSGPAEILDRGRYGRLIPLDDPARMAEAIIETLEHPPDRARLRTRAMTFSEARATERYVHLVSSLSPPDSEPRRPDHTPYRSAPSTPHATSAPHERRPHRPA